MVKGSRHDGTYQPQRQEEYLTDAIQQQKYLDILLHTTDIENSSEILSRDEVIFVEKALFLLTWLMHVCKEFNFLETMTFLLGLKDHAKY